MEQRGLLDNDAGERARSGLDAEGEVPLLYLALTGTTEEVAPPPGRTIGTEIIRFLVSRPPRELGSAGER